MTALMAFGAFGALAAGEVIYRLMSRRRRPTVPRWPTKISPPLSHVTRLPRGGVR